MSNAENKADSGREIVEIGWVAVGRMENTNLQAVQRTRKQLLAYLRRVFPEFEWRLPVATHEEFVSHLRGRAIRLLDMAGTDRDVRHWDFAILITEAPLVGHEKPTPWAAFSTSLGAIVVGRNRSRTARC